MTLKIIIVDDEPRAIDVLKEYAEKLSSLQLLATFRNPLKAFEFVKQNTVDVVFLDINMPNLSGIQFIKSLSHKPAIVLTTAYSEYAIESYELDVSDYLLKPIEFERFMQCANKLLDKLNPKLPNTTALESHYKQAPKADFIFVKHSTKLERIALNDLLYIEGSGNYLIYHTIQRKIMALGKMSNIIETLPEKHFFRIHKSYIVNWDKVKTIENNHIYIGQVKLSMSSTYKNNVMKAVKRLY